MKTPWGQMADLDLQDVALQEKVLSFDKHQVIEGLVVERLYEDILTHICNSGYQLIDVSVSIAKSRTVPARAFVWVRKRSERLDHLLALLSTAYPCHLVYYSSNYRTFMSTQERWQPGCRYRLLPLWDVLSEITGARPKIPDISSSVRNVERQKAAIWGFLRTSCGDQERINKIILPRIFRNFGIQPFFDYQWDVDQIYSDGEQLHALELKHKYPMRGRRGLEFGLNLARKLHKKNIAVRLKMLIISR